MKSSVDEATHTDRYRRVDDAMREKTETDLRSHVLTERGRGRPFRLILTDVIKITGVDFTETTLSNWFGRDPEIVAAFAAYKAAK